MDLYLFEKKRKRERSKTLKLIKFVKLPQFVSPQDSSNYYVVCIGIQMVQKNHNFYGWFQFEKKREICHFLDKTLFLWNVNISSDSIKTNSPHSIAAQEEWNFIFKICFHMFSYGFHTFSFCCVFVVFCSDLYVSWGT